jgi:phosphoglycolate phosphatase
MRPVELVLFDLDGTLIETAPEIRDAVNDLLTHYGWPTASPEQIERWIGHGTGELLLQAVGNGLGVATQALRESGRMAEIGPHYDEFYERRCGTRSRPYPGVRTTLEALRAGGIKTAIVTNKESRYTQRLLAAHALSGLFDALQCGDATPTRKPDPAGVLEILRRLEVPVGRSLFVGDSSIDVETARNAGLPIWLVPYGYNRGRPIAEAGGDRIIQSVAEVARALLGSEQRGAREETG